jgi:hypothetical protein
MADDDRSYRYGAPPKKNPDIFGAIFGSNTGLAPKKPAGQPYSSAGNMAPNKDNYAPSDPLNWQTIAAEQRAKANAAAMNGTPTASNPVGSVGQPVESPSAISAPEPVQPSTPSGIDVNALYDALIGKAKGYNDTGLAAYDESRDRVTGNYDRSNKEMYTQYMNSRNQAGDMASGLGASQDIYNNWDSGLRRVQENSDLALADNQSFFDKMKAAQNAAFQEYLAGVENDRVAKATEQNLAILDYMAGVNGTGGGSSGGGGRGGSGGSSSGDIKETAKQTDTVIDPEAYNTYLTLRATDPAAANLFYESYLASTGSPSVKALTETIGKTSAEMQADKFDPLAGQFGFNKDEAYLQAMKNNPNILSPGALKAERDRQARNTRNKKNLSAAKTARDGALSFSGIFNNPKSTQTVTTTASQKK